MPLAGSTVPDTGRILNENNAEAFNRRVDRFPEEAPVR